MTEDPDQHRDKRQKRESDSHEAIDAMEVERSTQPTNHDRNVDVKKEETTLHTIPESDDTSLDQLQKDMGDAFLLGRSSKALYATLISIHVY